MIVRLYSTTILNHLHRCNPKVWIHPPLENSPRFQVVTMATCVSATVTKNQEPSFAGGRKTVTNTDTATTAPPAGEEILHTVGGSKTRRTAFPGGEERSGKLVVWVLPKDHGQIPKERRGTREPVRLELQGRRQKIFWTFQNGKQIKAAMSPSTIQRRLP